MSAQTIELLLATAHDLLKEATRLDGTPDAWWTVSRVTKGDRPPFVVADEYKANASGGTAA